MSLEKANVKKEGAPAPKRERERHEIRISVNGNTILQRGFKVDEFNSIAYKSKDLTDVLDQCVEIIEDDLKKKTNLYLEFCAPQVLHTEDDVKPWLRSHETYRKDPMYIVLEDSDKVFILNNGILSEYTDKPYSKEDFFNEKPYDTKTILEFSLLDNGRRVITRSLDISQYPSFIRYNVDITNSRNRYRSEGVFSPMEFAMCEYFNNTRESLLPQITNLLTDVLSYESSEDYTTKVTYGNTTYDLSVYRSYLKTVRQMEKKYYQKTLEYNRRWA